MRVAIVAFGDGSQGDGAIGLEILSRLATGRFPVPANLVHAGTDVLRTLEGASSFDALIIVEAAAMGEPPGTVKTFDLNHLLLGSTDRAITFHNLRMDSELLFAQKFLDLPPTRLVCIEPESVDGPSISQTLLSMMDHYLKVIGEALSQF